MNRVSRQDFIRYTSKYLKEFPLIITNRGTDELLISTIEERAVTVIKQDTINIDKEKPMMNKINLETNNVWDEYRCGCKKIEGNKCCPKHAGGKK